MASLSRTDWRSVVRRVADGKVTPIVSDRVCSTLLPGQNGLIQAWADDIGYPMISSFSVTRLAQYLCTVSDELAAKEEFLSFSKRFLMKSSGKVNGIGRNELRAMSLSRLAHDLDQLPFIPGSSHPAYVLANLPLPIYITTSYYTFLEEALLAAGKAPRTEICYWRDELRATTPTGDGGGLNPLGRIRETVAERFNEEELRTLCYDLDVDYESLAAVGKGGKARELLAYLDRYQRLDELLTLVKQQRPDIDWASLSATSGAASGVSGDGIPSVFDLDRNYEPTWQEPLVYHLHGVESAPSSLVLTEDDHLDFLVKISWDNSAIPALIAEALADSSLLLLGYQLQDWDFRVLFRGLINSKRGSRRLLSLAIQLSLKHGQDEVGSMEEAEEYLEKYFDKANFKIYWGETQEFTDELWANWNE
jgi:hypothetical protein